MRVQCIAKRLTEEQLTHLNRVTTLRPDHEYHVKLGAEYVVFGLSFAGGLGWVAIEHIPEQGYLSMVPLFLFKIIDSRISRYWVVEQNDKGHVDIQPPAFFQEFFFDDLSNGGTPANKEYGQIRPLIVAEALQPVEGTRAADAQTRQTHTDADPTGMSMPVIHTDFERRDDEGRFVLIGDAGAADNANRATQLEAGTRVLLLMDGIAVEAILSVDEVWRATPDWATLHYR